MLDLLSDRQFHWIFHSYYLPFSRVVSYLLRYLEGTYCFVTEQPMEVLQSTGCNSRQYYYSYFDDLSNVDCDWLVVDNLFLYRDLVHEELPNVKVLFVLTQSSTTEEVLNNSAIEEVDPDWRRSAAKVTIAATPELLYSMETGDQEFLVDILSDYISLNQGKHVVVTSDCRRIADKLADCTETHLNTNCASSSGTHLLINNGSFTESKKIASEFNGCSNAVLVTSTIPARHLHGVDHVHFFDLSYDLYRCILYRSYQSVYSDSRCRNYHVSFYFEKQCLDRYKAIADRITRETEEFQQLLQEVEALEPTYDDTKHATQCPASPR